MAEFDLKVNRCQWWWRTQQVVPLLVEMSHPNQDILTVHGMGKTDWAGQALYLRRPSAWCPKTGESHSCATEFLEDFNGVKIYEVAKGIALDFARPCSFAFLLCVPHQVRAYKTLWWSRTTEVKSLKPSCVGEVYTKWLHGAVSIEVLDRQGRLFWVQHYLGYNTIKVLIASGVPVGM